MAGCCHVADAPETNDPNFGLMHVHISMEMTDSELITVIKNAELHGEKMARQAQKIAKERYSLDVYADKFVSAVREML